VKKKKVLHIVESFGSGVFTFLVDLVNGTDDLYDITIAYGVREETIDNFKEYFSKKVKFIQVENFTRSINPTKDIKAIKEIKKIVNEVMPDIVHMHSSKAGAIGRIAISSRHRKLIYNPHGFSFLKKDDSQLKRVIYRLIEKLLTLRKCTIVGCSQGEYEEARKLTKNSICINNGIDTKKIEEETKGLPEQEIDFEQLKICTSGRIGYQKNPEMFNQIAEALPDIQFTWIGDGELREELTSPNITITGWKERKEVLEILNQNDIFILTSLWEGLPISLLEAMYMGKICIVSNVIGNRNVIIDAQNGFIANDLQDYISKMKNLISTKNVKFLKENAQKTVNRIYHLDLMVNQYKQLYKGEKRNEKNYDY
jgi:glycosyltransferase involved in cell wall biosynthesis